MKKLLALLLSLAMALSLVACAVPAADKDGEDEVVPEPYVADGICASAAKTGQYANMSDEEYFENFTPAFRFVVASDVHVADLHSSQEEKRLAKLFEVAYAYAEGHGSYQKLDGVFFAGDVTDRGSVGSLQKFFSIAGEGVREGTTMRAVMGNHEYYDDKKAAEQRFLDASGYETSDAHLVIGGYHFIFLSTDKEGKGYGAHKQTYLANELAKAAADDPTGTKPIFVFQHHHITGTVYGSQEAWGVEDLYPVIRKYPQVVDFSGHSHFPINDPRSLWQGYITALGTGTLSYYELDLAGVRPTYVFPTDRMGSWATSATEERNAAQFYIVEVDANNAMMIQGYDLLSDTFMMEPYTFRCIDEVACRTYTDERADVSDTPVFGAGAAITEKIRVGKTVSLTFPQAMGEDLVQHYRCDVTKNGEALEPVYCLADTCFIPAPEELTLSVREVEAGAQYRVEIRAVNCWCKESEPLVYEFVG